MSRLCLYGAGGAGINLVANFLKHNGKKESGFADIQTFFLDTSSSNLLSKEPEDHVYIIDGVDGSGKKRDSNYRIIAERSNEMLHRFKPGDINIVIHSASGGSGSVIGPTLVSELLDRDVPTIIIMVGSSDSRIETHNTVNTLKSYEVISQKRETPVIAVYYENSPDSPRGEVDQRIKTTIILLAAIFSGENRELDSADLHNFLAYQKVTSFKPKLSYLDFFSKQIELQRDQTVVSLVTLTDENTTSAVDIPVEYQAVGFINDHAKTSVDVALPIHVAIISGFFHDVIERLSKRLNTFDEARRAHVDKSILTKDVDATPEGLVF